MRKTVPTLEEKNRALEVIKAMFKEGFYDCLNLDVNSVDRVDPVDWSEDHLDLVTDFHLSFSHGATKICIFDELNKNWVIKVSFDRSTDSDYVNRKIAYDFCKREADFYSFAVKEKLERYFAATYILTKINGMYITIQENVNCDEEVFVSILEDSIKDSFDINDFDSEDCYRETLFESIEEMDTDERIHAILDWSEEIAKLIDFLTKNSINDLHPGNWGIAKDGEYVMIDFSGYVC